MAATEESGFYRNLPTLELPLTEVLSRKTDFKMVPASWHVIITDIKNSTAAVQDGRHELVNLIATGSIVAALNIGYQMRVDIPFFFGGDGATMLVPAVLLQPCLAALYEHRNNTLQNFALDLRVGHMSMRHIYEKKHLLTLAKVRLTRYLNIPIILGTGLKYAEMYIKGADKSESKTHVNNDESTLDLTGMECRWNRIKPPRKSGEVVSLLVDAVVNENQSVVFAKVLGYLETIYGPIRTRNPISIERLKLGTDLKRIRTEMRTKLGKNDFLYLVKHWLFTLVGKIYYGRERNSRIYLENLVQLADTLVLDGRINTVISGTKDQCDKLVIALTNLEDSGEIIFGWYSSPESVMSCYVRNRVDQHIHFVDGSEGGYTQAAKMLKSKKINFGN